MSSVATTSTLSSILHNANQADHRAFAPRRPGETILYQVIQGQWLTFRREIEEEGRFLPRHVIREFEEFLQCGQLANGFLRLKCDACIHEKLVPFSCKKRSFCASCTARRMSEGAAFFVDSILPQEAIRQWVLSVPIPLRFWMANSPTLMTDVLTIMVLAISRSYSSRAKENGISESQTGSITLIQRAGGAGQLNIHFHTLMIEGVYEDQGDQAIFHKTRPPSDDEVKEVLQVIRNRVVRLLKKVGKLEEKEEGVTHAADFFKDDEGVEKLCQAASVQYRIALGERAGQRVRKVGSFGEAGENPMRDGPLCYSFGGFSLHANVVAERKQDIETLCRYVARPPIAESRLSESSDGNIIYRFKKMWADGTQALLFSPTEFLEKLVALVTPPRIHLSRFHGVLAPNSKLRSRVVPGSTQAMPFPASPGKEIVDKRSRPHRLSWSELLKRVFQIDITVCRDCGGQMTFIATILDPKVIRAILENRGISVDRPRFAPARAPPQSRLSFD